MESRMAEAQKLVGGNVKVNFWGRWDEPTEAIGVLIHADAEALMVIEEATEGADYTELHCIGNKRVVGIFR